MAGFGDELPIIGQIYELACKDRVTRQMKCESFDPYARTDKGAIRPRAMLRSVSDDTGMWRWGRVTAPWQTRVEKPVRGEADAPMPPEMRRGYALERRIAALEAEHRSFAARMLALESRATGPAPAAAAPEPTPFPAFDLDNDPDDLR